MLFSYFVSERAAREARRRTRILAQRKRRTIIRYSLVMFATVLLLVAASILFFRTRVYTEPSDEQVHLHDNSEHANTSDRRNGFEHTAVVNAADIQSSTRSNAESAFGEHSSFSQTGDESVQQQDQSNSRLDSAQPQTASASSSTTSHRLASVSDGYGSLSVSTPASIEEKARLSPFNTHQQPLDTIGDEEGGNGIIITLDEKKASQSTTSRKDELPNASQAGNNSRAELKTALKVSGADGDTFYSHADSSEPANTINTTIQNYSSGAAPVDTNTDVRQETHRNTNTN
ncbi:unnamed protein product [Agarophyton chilense]|eukprot:gb/GEZJ01000116.1/.p1 GENE.gb/GEZJ01000116.1/~~gb/GEZJ01000116.1/.p1  ORF type:complete len:288 (-),score=41.98 gb/GEZJ01000116.1/:2394-3257(-)